MRALGAFLIALSLALPLGAAPDASQPVPERIEVDIEAARILAFKFIASGHNREAADIATLLTRRDKNDQAAWLALAQAQRGLGNAKAAHVAAKKAWKLADTPEEKYAASLVASHGLQAEGKLTRAQLWLRRAAHHAPQPQMRTRAVEEFKAVRSANPWSTQLSFSVSPTSNINNGAKSERVHGGTISGSALALSGLEYKGFASTRYRLPGSDRTNPWVGASLLARAYTLSDNAKAVSPTSQNGDFAFQEVELSYGNRIVAANKRAATDLRVDVGVNRSGGVHLSNFGTLTLSQTRLLGQRDRIGYGGSLERIERQDVPDRSATVATAFGNWSRGFENGNRLGFSVTAANSASSSTVVDHARVGLGASYTWADAPMNTSVDLSLSLEARNYHRPLVLFGNRDDRTASVGVTVTLKDRDYYGFVPTIGLSAATTNSTVDFYDTETIGVRFGLRSSF